MKFSTKSEYGLRALSNLDKKGKISVSLAKIAREEGLSLAYLERLFAVLKKADIVISEKGNLGGYRLARSASKISVLEVLEALEGSVLPANCLLRPKTCHCLDCKVLPVWEKLNKQIRITLQKIKLKEILK
ncbi:MAG: Rrf2 family transcriptional regulator [Patescibacteria group bacterium]